MGFRVNQISLVLDVTPPAVTQYLKGVRGKKITETENQKQMIDALAEKGAQRINGNMEPLSTIELLDVAHQILAVTSGERMLGTRSESRKKSKSIAILKARLQLELKAGENVSIWRIVQKTTTPDSCCAWSRQTVSDTRTLSPK